MGHPPARAGEMLTKFSGYLRGQQERMLDAKAHNRWAPPKPEWGGGSPVRDRTHKSVRSLAHAVRGAASMIGAHRLVTSCRALQDAAEAFAEFAGGALDESAITGEAPPPPDPQREEAVRVQALAALEVWLGESARLLKVLDDHDPAELVTRSKPILSSDA